MSRHHRVLSKRQRDKQSDDRHQANFRESYLDHMVETAHIGIRHFGNPIVLRRKRKKPKHKNLDALITYLHHKTGIEVTDETDIEMKSESTANKKRPRQEEDTASVFERRRKRRKLRHCLDQIRNHDDIQKAFYESSKYSNLHQEIDAEEHSAPHTNNNHYCIWKFHHQRSEAQQIMYESDHRCVLCLKYEPDISSLQRHVICWHSKLSFDIGIIHPHLNIIHVECKPSNQSYLKSNNRDLNEYYYGWINIWNHFYFKCDANLRSELNAQFVVNPNATDTDIDIARLHALKWDFHHKLSIEMTSRGRMMGRRVYGRDILDTFSLSCNQFKNRNISSLTNKEKLWIVDEVLKYPLMNGRMSKLCKFIALPNTKYLKKLMAIYPMLLLLNKKEISLHLISKWTEWKCNIKKDIRTEHITNNDLKHITLKQILSAIRDHEKGIAGIAPKYKLWLCLYILSHGGKSFISGFKHHLETLESLNETDTTTYITNSSLYNVYYNFCGYMMLCGQFPLSKQGKQAMNKWWNEVQRVFGFGFIRLGMRAASYNNNNNKSYRNHKENKAMHRTVKDRGAIAPKRRVTTLKEKVIAMRDIIYNEKAIAEYSSVFEVKEKTIIRWIRNCKKILQKCEAEGELDGIARIYDEDNTNVDPNEIQFKSFMTKAMEYLNARKAKKKTQQTHRRTHVHKSKEETDYEMEDREGSEDSEDPEYDPMNESAMNRRVASILNPKSFEREYKTRNVNLRRGGVDSHDLKYNKGYYHGTTFGRIHEDNVSGYKEGSDTENECDDEWLLNWESNLLFDFQDISFGEKLMMKYWNEFIRKRNQNKIYASFMVPVKLIEFAQSHKDIIAQNNLKLPFLFHCITLWEFGFIEAKCIQEAMRMVHGSIAKQSQCA